MNIEDCYHEKPELMTAEEREEYQHVRNEDEIPTFPSWWHTKLMDSMGMQPDQEGRAKFEQRPPALGLSMADIEAISQHANDPRLRPVQQRLLFKHIRERMLRMLISADGISTTQGLLEVLREEVRSGTPAPVPDWYTFSPVIFGPRRMGYYKCERRGCFRTENLRETFSRCSRCQLAYYCSQECQKQDWRERHKAICKHAAEQREQTARVGGFVEMFRSGMRA